MNQKTLGASVHQKPVPEGPGLRRQAVTGALGPLVPILKGTVGFIGAAVIWELLRALGVLPPAWVPSVPTLIQAWWGALVDGTWFSVLAPTLFSWLFGLLSAVVIGVAWGVAAGISPVVSASSRIVIRLLRPIPSVALIPVAILALGTGTNMILALVMFASVWPILFNTLYAVREIPEQYYDVARTMGFSRSESLIKVTGVAILPGFMTGLRVASGIALVVTVSAELVTGSTGLGGHILEMRTAGRLGEAYASVLMGGVLGLVLNSVVVWMQRSFLAWSPDNRKAEA